MTSVSLEVWQERCGIVQFCSGRDMSKREAEDIVAAQLGLSDAECRTLVEASGRRASTLCFPALLNIAEGRDAF